MKIVSSAVAMTSQHQFVASFSKTENFRMWKNVPQNRSGASKSNPKTDLLQISDQARAANQVEQKENQPEKLEISEQDKQKIKLIEKILSAMSGKKIKLNIPAKLDIKPNPAGGVKINVTIPRPQTNPNEGSGMVYELHEIYQESEMMNFAAQGIVQTADGKEINFTTQLQLARQYTSEEHISIKSGDALKDPIVINFGGASAMLSTNKIEFDLDADGEKDNISFVNPGSGFLAIDKNNNGLVDDGTELFGPATGNGFLELAEYDEDQNGWIDENDPVYEKLRIWTYDGDQHQLATLKQKNVGAISVGSIDTEFQYKNSKNQLEGLARSTGIFLKEDGGGAGTIQQIDLVV
jgi:hypothetical protein